MSPWITTWISVGLGLVVQQETGDPGAGAAYAEKVCARCHTIKGARPSPEPTAPPFEVVANTPGMIFAALTSILRMFARHDRHLLSGVAYDVTPYHAQYRS